MLKRFVIWNRFDLFSFNPMEPGLPAVGSLFRQRLSLLGENELDDLQGLTGLTDAPGSCCGSGLSSQPSTVSPPAGWCPTERL